nr:MAG TPA: hypothetical protein [Caudoviricetes sp.]
MKYNEINVGYILEYIYSKHSVICFDALAKRKQVGIDLGLASFSLYD